MTRTIGAIIGAGLTLLAGTQAQAQTNLAALPGMSYAAAAIGEARPVTGWVDFCERNPSECRVNTAEPAIVTLTPHIWRTVVAVNRKVNDTITAVTDQDHWGVIDSWDFPTDGFGDCEDYQLLKRKRLIEAGLPARALRMTVVIDEKREGHAVLMLRTDRGDFILDNKTNTVLPWHQTGYTYVKREGHASAAWVSLGGAVSPTVTANR